MTDLELAETRAVLENPTHGPVLLDELARLRAELADVKAKWATDDREARLLRFALYEIEAATKRGSVPQVLTAVTDAIRAARLIAGHSTPAVTNLLKAVAKTLRPDNIGLFDLESAYTPFKEVA